MSDEQIARLLDCSIARLLDCSIARLLDCSIARLLDCSTARLRAQKLSYPRAPTDSIRLSGSFLAT